MAKNDAYFIANPTFADITVGGQTIKAGHVAKLTIEDESHAAYVTEWLCAGCSIAPASLTNPTKSVAEATRLSRTAVEVAEAGAKLLSELIRSTVSIGANAYAEKGA